MNALKKNVKNPKYNDITYYHIDNTTKKFVIWKRNLTLAEKKDFNNKYIKPFQYIS